jgi:hypothetical protein
LAGSSQGFTASDAPETDSWQLLQQYDAECMATTHSSRGAITDSLLALSTSAADTSIAGLSCSSSHRSSSDAALAMALQRLVAACRAFADTCGPIIGEFLGYQLILADLQREQAVAAEQQAYKAAAAASEAAAAVGCSSLTHTSLTPARMWQLLQHSVQRGGVLLRLSITRLLTRLRSKKHWCMATSLLLTVLVAAAGAVGWFTGTIWNAKRGESLSNACTASMNVLD